MNANEGRSNVMDKFHVKDVATSVSIVYTRRIVAPPISKSPSKASSDHESHNPSYSMYTDICRREYRKMSSHISNLQDQVETLFANMNSLRADFANSQPQIDPSLQQHPLVPSRGAISGPQSGPGTVPPRPRTDSQSKARPPTFRGPTSAEFNLGVARHSLQTMGIAAPDDALGTMTADASPSGTPPPEAAHHPNKDPIWQVSRGEALRLVKVFGDDMHEMYPTISIPHLLDHVESLYTYMEAALRNHLVEMALPGADTIDDEDTNILKMVLAIAMVLEGSGKSDLGRRMYRFVQPSIDALLLGHASFKGIRLLSLVVRMMKGCCRARATTDRTIVHV